MAKECTPDDLLEQHRKVVDEQKDIDDLFRQAGRAIVTLSNIENLMAVAFAIVSQRMTVREACSLFDTYRSFDQKLKLVEYAIQHNDLAGEYESWVALRDRLQRQKFVRNLAAHQRMYYKPAAKSGKRTIVLTNHWYTKSRDRELEIADLKAAADELEGIHNDMWKFIGGLAPHEESNSENAVSATIN